MVLCSNLVYRITVHQVPQLPCKILIITRDLFPFYVRLRSPFVVSYLFYSFIFAKENILCCWSSWISFELYDEVQSKLWKPVNNIHPFVDKPTLDTIQSVTSDDKLNIYGSPNDLLSEYRSQVTSSIALRHSQYFRAERELRVQFWTFIEYQLCL